MHVIGVNGALEMTFLNYELSNTMLILNSYETCSWNFQPLTAIESFQIFSNVLSVIPLYLDVNIIRKT